MTPVKLPKDRPMMRRSRFDTSSSLPIPLWVWVVGLALVVILPTLLFVVLNRDDAPPETAFAEAIGEPLPPLVDPDPAIGQQLPAVSAQSVTGERVQLLPDGTARVIGFFAHWCPVCQEELPELSSWMLANGYPDDLPDNVEIVAISTAINPDAANYPPSEWFERESWPATVLVDNPTNALAQGLGLESYPYWVVVDGDSTVLTRVAGAVSPNQFGQLIDIASASVSQ